MEADAQTPTAQDELAQAWPDLTDEERVEHFLRLPRGSAGTFFLTRDSNEQAQLVRAAPDWEKRLLMRMLDPDDATDVVQQFPQEERPPLLAYLDDVARREVHALLAYAEDDAGGLMNPRFVRVRPDMTVDEAFAYARRQSRERAEIIHYLYVLDAEQKLLGILSFRDLFAAAGGARVSEVMTRDFVSVKENTDQEEVARTIADLDVVALPVLDDQGRMRGIVTLDDIVDVVQEEATEDIQKIGGQAALDKPYLETSFWEMVRKRAGWLTLLFLGGTLTVSAMGSFQKDVAAAAVLALFVPLVISSGGNSGSQATTLVVRSMALGEVRLRDVVRVAGLELRMGLALGAILAIVGGLRVLAWEGMFGAYGEKASLLALTLGVSVIGVVAWGTLVGAMLPFLLRRMGFDPASASAPFVATLVDVFGLIIYFGTARLVYF